MINITRSLTAFLLLIFLSIFSVEAEAQDDKDTKDSRAMNAFLDAEKYKMLENYPEAVKLYEKTLEIDSEYDPAMFQLARLYLYDQKFNEALFWMERAHIIDPKNKWYSLLLIDLYRNNYQIAAAISIYRKLLEEEPNNTEYLLSLSGLYHSLDDYENAMICIDKIEKLNGISESTSFQKRNLYMQENNFNKAVDVMIELSETYPQEEKYCSMIAEMYMQQKQTEKALPWYEKVLEINPNNPYIQITLADYYAKQNDLEKAYEYLKEGYSNSNLDIDTKVRVLMSYFEASNSNTLLKSRAFELAKILVETHPNEAKSHAIYGDLLFRDSLFVEASQEFIRVIEIDSTRYPVWEQLLYSLSMTNSDTLLANYSDRAIAQFPQMEFPYYVGAIAQYRLGEVERVIEIIEQGLYFVSNEQLLEQFYMFLGDAYHENKQNDKAYEAYENCLKIKPNNSFVLNNYAYYLSIEDRDLQKAEKMAAKAIETDPNSNNLDTYGWVLYKLGKYTEAQKYIEQSIDESDPPSPEVLEHMGDVLHQLDQKSKAKSFWRKAKKAGGDQLVLDKKINSTYWDETD